MSREPETQEAESWRSDIAKIRQIAMDDILRAKARTEVRIQTLLSEFQETYPGLAVIAVEVTPILGHNLTSLEVDLKIVLS